MGPAMKAAPCKWDHQTVRSLVFHAPSPAFRPRRRIVGSCGVVVVNLLCASIVRLAHRQGELAAAPTTVRTAKLTGFLVNRCRIASISFGKCNHPVPAVLQLLVVNYWNYAIRPSVSAVVGACVRVQVKQIRSGCRESGDSSPERKKTQAIFEYENAIPPCGCSFEAAMFAKVRTRSADSSSRQGVE